MKKDIVPIKVGQELYVNIVSIGEKGDGVAFVNGFVVFVKNAIKGQDYNVTVDKVLAHYAFATIQK